MATELFVAAVIIVLAVLLVELLLMVIRAVKSEPENQGIHQRTAGYHGGVAVMSRV